MSPFKVLRYSLSLEATFSAPPNSFVNNSIAFLTVFETLPIAPPTLLKALAITFIGAAIADPTMGISAIPDSTAPNQSLRTTLIPTFTPSAISPTPGINPITSMAV